MSKLYTFLLPSSIRDLSFSPALWYYNRFYLDRPRIRVGGVWHGYDTDEEWESESLRQ